MPTMIGLVQQYSFHSGALSFENKSFEICQPISVSMQLPFSLEDVDLKPTFVRWDGEDTLMKKEEKLMNLLKTVPCFIYK